MSVYELEPDTRQDLHLGHLGVPWNALDERTLRNVLTAVRDELRARGLSEES